jgi:3-oxoacid CoA-transferase subunit B
VLFRSNGLRLVERAPGVSVEEIQKATAAKMEIPAEVPEMKF